jgi:hypothetical protein
VIRNILEKYHEYSITLHQLFIDFKHAYDSVRRNQLFDTMTEFGITRNLIRMVKTTLSNTTARIKVHELPERSDINTGLRQGDVISSQLFNLCLEKVIRNIDINSGETIYNRTLQVLAYADLVARNTVRFADGLVELEVAACTVGLNVNEKKTKYIISTREEHRYSDITCFTVNQYLMAGNRCYYDFQKLLRLSLISRRTKIRIYRTV